MPLTWSSWKWETSVASIRSIPKALLQSADPVEDRPSVGYVGFGRLEPGLQVVAVVDGHDLARVAEHEVGLRAGVLRAVQVGQDLFDIVLVRVLQRFGDAGLDLLEALQVRLEGRDGAGRVVHRVPQAREQPVRPAASSRLTAWYRFHAPV